MEVGTPEEFKNKPFEEKFDFLIRLKKIINKAKMQKEINELVEGFREEMQRTNYQQIYALFREAERNLNMQKTLPREYLEEF